MIYTLDDGQLLGIWTAIRYLGEIREIPDPTDRSEVLTKAQALLTAFVLELKPLLGDQPNLFALRTALDEMTGYDA